METNPNIPRQRSRRADRTAAMEQSPQQAQAVPQQPSPQPVPVHRPYQQPAYPQSPRTMYQQQPVRPTAASYQPSQQHSGYQQLPQQTQMPVQRQSVPVQQMQPPLQRQSMPVQQVQPAPRPRVLNQPGGVNSGWQQPTLRESAEVPRARAARSLSREQTRSAAAAQREADARARQEVRDETENKPVRKKLPGWLTTALSLSIILVMALGAAYWLMQAYLTTQENQRIAAYQAVLENYHVTEQPDGTLRVTWQDAIERYAAQYNLQPAFVTAIIRNESSFRTNAESNVGARGLMQMMPDTAEWIAGKLDDSTYTFDSMWDAEMNIRYGCWYLGYLSKLFHGDAELVSAAYHAGQSTVTQWLSDPAKSADGVSLDMDSLADGPTKQYIGRVTQTYGIYQTLLYPDEAFGAADDLSAGSSSAAAAVR